MTLLLLAGTQEGHMLARRLADTGADVLVSLAGVVQDHAAYPYPTRSGGFGGEAGFRAFVRAAGISTVMDATHPFASKISRRTAKVCDDLTLGYCRFLRPSWEARDGDNWQQVDTPEMAASQVRDGARVFLATGAKEIMRYAGMAGRAHVICRRAEAAEQPFPFAGGQWITGRGPFDVDDEIALFQWLGVEVIITKNSGGRATYAKIEAARSMGLPVIMIDRPGEPDGVACVSDIDTAMARIAGQV